MASGTEGTGGFSSHPGRALGRASRCPSAGQERAERLAAGLLLRQSGRRLGAGRRRRGRQSRLGRRQRAEAHLWPSRHRDGAEERRSRNLAAAAGLAGDGSRSASLRRPAAAKQAGGSRAEGSLAESSRRRCGRCCRGRCGRRRWATGRRPLAVAAATYVRVRPTQGVLLVTGRGQKPVPAARQQRTASASQSRAG